MSQFDFGNLESPLSGTAFINTYLEPWRDAVHSQHSGSARPAYAVAGMIWLDTTTSPWIVNMFNGTADDVVIGYIHPTNLWFLPAGTSTWAGSAGGTANALTFTPTIPWTAYSTGKPFEGLITATNTSETVTVNISALGNKNVKCSVGVGKVNIPKGALQNGMIGQFVYDGTDLILLNVRADNKSADIATSGTLNLDAATGDYVLLTGTTTVTAVTLSEGQERTCVCAGAFILTDGTGTSPQGIILPGAANITTAAGDIFTIRGEAGGTTRVTSYTRASGLPLAGATRTYLHLQDQKASGTDGGSSTAGSWQTRTLNTEVADTIGSTLASNQFTLPAGTYQIEASAAAFYSSQHQIRLQNITDTATTLLGTTELNNPTSGESTARSFINGVFTIAGTKTFEIQHRVAVSKATNGYGVAAGWGTEIYTNVFIEKL